MEREHHKQITAQVDTYELTVKLQEQLLHIDAYSEHAGRLYQATLEDNTLPFGMSSDFGSCRIIYNIIEDAVERHTVHVHSRKLVVGYVVMLGRKEVSKQMAIPLEELLVDDMVRLRIRVNKAKECSEELQREVERTAIDIKLLKEELERALKIAVRNRIHLKIESGSMDRELLHYNAGMFSVRDQIGMWRPLFLSQACIVGQSYFDVDWVEGNRKMEVGISIKDNNVRQAVRFGKGAIVLEVSSSSVIVGSLRVCESEYRVQQGDRIRVTVNLKEHEVRWDIIHPTPQCIGNALIPEHLRACRWYPFIGLAADYFGTVVLL